MYKVNTTSNNRQERKVVPPFFSKAHLDKLFVNRKYLTPNRPVG